MLPSKGSSAIATGSSRVTLLQLLTTDNKRRLSTVLAQTTQVVGSRLTVFSIGAKCHITFFI